MRSARRAGLEPAGREQPPFGHVAGGLGDEHLQGVVGAVVGDVGRLLVGHHIGQLDRVPPHRIVLLDLGIAIDVHRDLDREAVVVGIEHRLGLSDGRRRRIEAPVAHEVGVGAAGDLRQGGGAFGLARVLRILLGAEVRAPRRHAARARIPEAVHAREVDGLGGSDLEVARGVLRELAQVHAAGLGLEVSDFEELPADLKDGGEVVRGRHEVGRVDVLDRVTVLVDDAAEHRAADDVAAAGFGHVREGDQLIIDQRVGR